MKNTTIKDEQLPMLVVNGYSLGSIILLLERLNLLIESENGERNRVSNQGFFFEENPASFDKEQGVFRYCLECPVIEIFEEFFNFCAKGTNGINSYETSFDVWVHKKKYKIWQFKQLDFKDFFRKWPEDFRGLTLKEWGKAFESVTDVVCQKIVVFMPDFKFDLEQLHMEDKEHFSPEDFPATK